MSDAAATTLLTAAPAPAASTTTTAPAAPAAPAASPAAPAASPASATSTTAAAPAPAATGTDATKADDATKTGETKPVEGAPEKYEDFKVPEGVKLDPEITTDSQTLAKELNLTQEKAQKVADLLVKANSKQAAAQADVLKSVHSGWVEQSKADKEFGGDNLEQNLGVAQKALATFGSPQLKALLLGSGLGDHPDMVRMFYRIGKQMSEDKFVAAGAATTAQTTEERFYPTMKTT